jgi:hypothetical protein
MPSLLLLPSTTLCSIVRCISVDMHVTPLLLHLIPLRDHSSGCIHDTHSVSLHHCAAEALKQAYQTAVSKLQSQFQRQLQAIELRVHSHHHSSSTGPVSAMHAQLEQVKVDNASLQVC